jgi:hypothetical protein
MKAEWIVQLALPWMVSDPEEPKKEEVRRKTVGRYTHPCALALAEMNLIELGPEAKCRVYNPRTGEYDAMLYTAADENGNSPKEERIKVFHGRENRDKS